MNYFADKNEEVISTGLLHVVDISSKRKGWVLNYDKKSPQFHPPKTTSRVQQKMINSASF